MSFMIIVFTFILAGFIITSCYKGDPGYGDPNYPDNKVRDAGKDK